MEKIYCKNNNTASIISLIVMIGCFWLVFGYSLKVFNYLDDPITFWVLTIVLGPMELIACVLIGYSIAFTAHNFKTLGIDKKPVATYDDETFHMYDPMVFKYRVFKWEDIDCFEGYYYNGMSKIQVKLKDPKLVFMYNYQVTFKGMSFGVDLKGQEFQAFVHQLNQKLANRQA